MVVRPGSDPVEHVRSTHESVRAGGDRLRSVINQTTLGLDAILGYQFPITDTTASMYEQIHNDLDITARIATLETERGVETPTPTGLYLQRQTLRTDQATETGNRRTSMATIEVYQNPHRYRGVPRPTYTDYTDAQAEIARIDAQLARIDADIRAAQQRIASIQQELRGLEQFTTPGGLYAGAATARHTEFNHIQANAVNGVLYQITNTIPHHSYQAGATGIAPVDLDTIFVGGVTTPPAAGTHRYSLITQHNNAYLGASGSRIEVQAYDDAGRQHTLQLSGIRINGTNLEFDNIQIEGSATDITYPIRVHDMSVRCTRQDGGGRSFYHDKPLSLTITAAAQMSPADRRAHFGAVETNMTRNVVQGRLLRNYNDHYDRIEGTAFEAVLAENELYSKVVTQQREKDELMENIRGLTTRGGATGGVALHPVVSSPGLTGGGTVYDNFVDWLVNECEAPAEALRSEDAYRSWIRNQLETHTQNYLQSRVDAFIQRAEVRTTINNALYSYVSQLDAERQNPDGSPDPITAMNFEEQIARTGALMPHQQRNYLEFLSNQSQTVQGSVRSYQYNPHTGREEAGSETVQYSLDLAMGTPSPMNAKLTIGQEEIEIKSAGNHVALMRHVLSNPSITDQNVRYHVCLSIMKALVMMANRQGVLIHGYDRAGNDLEANIVNDKLQLRQGVFHGPSRTKNWRILFDENRFDKTQEVSSASAFPGGASSLRSGILGVAEYFNRSMDHYYEDLVTARRTRRYTSLMQHPKRGWWFGSSYRNLSFDDQTISRGDQTISIGCVRGIFRLTIPGREEAITDGNLGRLLNRPELRGAELLVIRAANQQLLQMYRNKPSIASRNYGVRDERTGRVYIIDEQGDIGMVEHDPSVRFARSGRRGRRTDYGRVTTMPLGMRLLNETERNHFLQNPYLIGLITRAMNRDF